MVPSRVNLVHQSGLASPVSPRNLGRVASLDVRIAGRAIMGIETFGRWEVMVQSTGLSLLF